MPNILELKANFASADNVSRPGGVELPSAGVTSVDDLLRLKKNMEEVKGYWDRVKKEHKKLPSRLIVEVYYNGTVAKSRRVTKLLVFPNRIPVNNDIVGVRFKEKSHRHIISYALPYKNIEGTIDHLDNCIRYMKDNGIRRFNADSLHRFNEKKKNDGAEDDFKKYNLCRSTFVKTIVDAYYIEKIDAPIEFEVGKDARIITFFNIDEISKLIRLAGLESENLSVLGNSMLLDNRQQSIVHSNAPYLVSMSVTDMAKMPEFKIIKDDIRQPFTIPDPDNEPIVGVIDTQFNERTYFHKWVDYEDALGGEVTYKDEDYMHGTAVSSIIVDGPTFERRLDDNCGRFRVKHFGVGTHKKISIFTIARNLEEWVRANPEIHVWNISLGTESEIERNSISFLASVLDKIQSEYDVIFVVAGTNDNDGTLSRRIGSPADSINSLVVNSVNSKGEKPKYARKGPALSFFMKPDVCAFGGDVGDEMTVYGFVDTRLSWGTSLATPWISRKLAYLVDKMNLSIPVAKAIIIDSAVSWDLGNADIEHEYYGYGIVPIKIEDVLNSKKDEIKFYLDVNVESYHTFLYDIPVPLINNRFPFIAKATMCYATECSRNYGVDYTNTELDFKFGRVKGDGTIDSINDDRQYESGHFTYEEDSRRYFRKWDNVKIIVQKAKPGLRDKKRFSDQLWGIDIKTVSRNTEKQKHIRVGIVVTLKELHGINRHNSFVQLCRLRHFIVNEIDIESRVELDNLMQQQIELE